MTKKIKFRIYAVLIVIFAVITTRFLLERMSSKKITSLMDVSIKDISSCTIGRLGFDDLVLDGDDLEILLLGLEDYNLYLKGGYNNILEGSLFHLTFISQNDTVLYIVISDKNTAYFNNYKYEISEVQKSMFEFIETFYY